MQYLDALGAAVPVSDALSTVCTRRRNQGLCDAARQARLCPAARLPAEARLPAPAAPRTACALLQLLRDRSP